MNFSRDRETWRPDQTRELDRIGRAKIPPKRRKNGLAGTQRDPRSALSVDMTISGLGARVGSYRRGATDVTPRAFGITESTAIPRSTKPRRRTWPGLARNLVPFDSNASYFSSMFCGAPWAPWFHPARHLTATGQVRRPFNRSLRTAKGRQVVVTPGQKGGSRRLSEGGEFRQIVSGR